MSNPATAPIPLYGQPLYGQAPQGTALRAGVFNEHEVRAAAGLTMVVGAVGFGPAYFQHQYLPLRLVTAFLCAEFLVRVTVGLRYSPASLVARALLRGRPPEWVLLVRRGWSAADPAFEICAHGACGRAGPR